MRALPASIRTALALGLFSTIAVPAFAQRGPAATATKLPADVLSLACAPSLTYEAPVPSLLVTGGQDGHTRKAFAPGDLITIKLTKSLGTGTSGSATPIISLPITASATWVVVRYPAVDSMTPRASAPRKAPGNRQRGVLEPPSQRSCGACSRISPGAERRCRRHGRRARPRRPGRNRRHPRHARD